MNHGNPYEFEDGGAEKRGLVWMALTILLVLALAIAFCWVDRQNAALAEVVEDAKPETYEEEYLPGQPLDAVKVTAPSFADDDCGYSYKVADRTSGACWWLVKVEGGWRVLPVCEGRSYVAQQTGEE